MLEGRKNLLPSMDGLSHQKEGSNMNVSFSIGEKVNGYTITDRNGLNHFCAKKDNIRIWFLTDAGEGINYSKPLHFHDDTTNKHYTAMCYLYKYVSTVQGFSNALYQKWRTENK